MARLCALRVESHYPFPEHQQVSSGVVFRRRERVLLVRPRSHQRAVRRVRFNTDPPQVDLLDPEYSGPLVT